MEEAKWKKVFTSWMVQLGLMLLPVLCTSTVAFIKGSRGMILGAVLLGVDMVMLALSIFIGKERQ